MTFREYRMALGVDLRGAALTTLQIAGIAVENPSGSWLRITGIEQWVPPYNKGFTWPVHPTQPSIDVLFTPSPSGSPSVNTQGGAPTVTIYSEPQAANPGVYSGEKESQSPSTALVQVEAQIFAASELGGGPVTLIDGTAVTPNRAIVPRKASLATALVSLNTDNLRAAVQCYLISQVSGIAICRPLIITPEYQVDETTTPEGVILEMGEGVNASLVMSPGGGYSNLSVRLEYIFISRVA